MRFRPALVLLLMAINSPLGACTSEEEQREAIVQKVIDGEEIYDADKNFLNSSCSGY